MRILILPDTPGWVVNCIADSLISRMPGVEFVKRYYASTETRELAALAAESDVVWYMNWGDTERHIPALVATGTPILLSIRSHRYPPVIRQIARQCAAVHVVNRKLVEEFPGSYCIPDGIEDRFFRQPVVGFVGKPDAYKGYPLIVEVCKRLGLELRTATGDVPHKDMPAFYRSIDVLVCASEAEGTCLPVMEALAMGVRVVSTQCGAAWYEEMDEVEWTRRDAISLRSAIEKALPFSSQGTHGGRIAYWCGEHRLQDLRWSNLAPEYEALLAKVAAMKAVAA